MNCKQYPPPGFIERLRDAILLSGMTITEIANRAKLSRQLIYGYAYDGVVPSTQSLYRICLVLHISADYLLFGKEVTQCNT